jgi:hypothetical protein
VNDLDALTSPVAANSQSEMVRSTTIAPKYKNELPTPAELAAATYVCAADGRDGPTHRSESRYVGPSESGNELQKPTNPPVMKSRKNPMVHRRDHRLRGHAKIEERY